LKPKDKAYPIEIRTLGDHIRQRRLDVGLRQAGVAAEIGICESTIMRWETNRAEPETRYVPRIIEFLGYCPYRPTASFREWLRQCRAAWGLSQEALAQALSVDESTVAHWERGDHRPTRALAEQARGFFDRALVGRKDN
jgi:DNA-binding transcriptional regulator YiaG